MPRTQEKFLIMNHIPLFADLSASDRRFIADSSLIVEYKKGDIIYKEGDPPDALYCVVAGRLKASVRARDRVEDLEYLKRNRFFGMISTLTGETHSATVQAVNDSIVLKVPKDAFGKILKRIPELAIHFSQMLSRRARTNIEAPGKKVFESTIISAFGLPADAIAVSDYVSNLGIGLVTQTGKRAILLNFAAGSPSGAVIIDSPFFDESLVRAGILKQPSGVDAINIFCASTTHLGALLSYLTEDYHYVLSPLRDITCEVELEMIKQSDMVHIITSSDETSLASAAGIVSKLESSPAGAGRKISIITAESGVKKPLDFAAKKAILKHDIYATLPDREYSKMIRRISRQIGDCLIGLALGSGAALGLAHVGILRVLEREKIPVDVLAGTSIGALIGALWASGRSASDIEKIISIFHSRIATLRLVDLTWPGRGLIKGREVRRFLRSQFGDKTFYDLRMPLKVIACDLEKRKEVVLDEGPLVDAIMASIAIPGIFQPVKIKGVALVDGGIINPVPTNVLMRAGASKIIAVNTLSSPEDVQRSERKISNIFDFIVNTVEAGEYLLAEMSCQSADIAMHPILPTADWYEFYKAGELIKRGEEEALKYLPQLKELASAK